MVNRRRRKKTKKRRFKTGVHTSNKCKNGPVKYRSGWEKIFCEYLDWNDDVLFYEYEPFEIKWVSNMKTCRIRSYLPDFLVTFKDGTRKLCEVKSKRFLERPHVQKKARHGRSWAANNNAEYCFIVDDDIKRFTKILKEEENKK